MADMKCPKCDTPPDIKMVLPPESTMSLALCIASLKARQSTPEESAP